jgi:hypothetical protein
VLVGGEEGCPWRVSKQRDYAFRAKSVLVRLSVLVGGEGGCRRRISKHEAF